MWALPKHGNHIIQYIEGDGFRTKLPEMLNGYHLLITHKATLKDFKNTRGRCVTVQGLTKLLENEEPKQTCIILDVRIPRISSKAYKSLHQLCVDRNLIILHSPLHDVESVNTLMVLLSLTKRKVLGLKVWSDYVYNRLRFKYKRTN